MCAGLMIRKHWEGILGYLAPHWADQGSEAADFVGLVVRDCAYRFRICGLLNVFKWEQFGRRKSRQPPERPVLSITG